MQSTPFVPPPMLPDFNLLGQSDKAPATSQRMHDLLSIEGRFEPSTVRAGVEDLNKAFEAIQAHGILTRHDYSCCSVCGSAEIRDEVAKACQAGLSVDGFVFYPSDAAATASETGTLSLTFGSHIGSGVSASQVAKRVVQCLHAAGLSAIWSGDPAERITVILAA